MHRSQVDTHLGSFCKNPFLLRDFSRYAGHCCPQSGIESACHRLQESMVGATGGAEAGQVVDPRGNRTSVRREWGPMRDRANSVRSLALGKGSGSDRFMVPTPAPDRPDGPTMAVAILQVRDHRVYRPRLDSHVTLCFIKRYGRAQRARLCVSKPRRAISGSTSVFLFEGKERTSNVTTTSSTARRARAGSEMGPMPRLPVLDPPAPFGAA